MEQHLRTDLHVVKKPRRRLGKRLAPYLLVAPGGTWLLLFFLIPILFMASVSLQTGDLYQGFKMTWHFGTYLDVIKQYHVQLVRSLLYATIATVATLVISYPMAYWIAFHGGKHKTTFLFMLLLPFFVSFVIRTLAWKFILSDEGIVFGALKSWHLIPANFHILATSTAVISGIAYNFLPFMALPLYVSLENIDHSVVEASRDLYASEREVFTRVILPLSIPGIFGGILLTFVPAVGDYVNASILGGTNTTMIGNIVQLEFLQNFHYPIAAALSFILMGGLLVGILAYARFLGARSIEDYV
ncbi:MAG: ABC transporter permease [Actinomycetota bacterium]|nr:ABC transporter permease [Actinomycetota bacterium]